MNPNFRVALVDLFFAGNVGVRGISAALQKEGCDVREIYSVAMSQDIEGVPERQEKALAELLESLRPDLLGFSFLSTMAYGAVAPTLRRLKARLGVPVVVGGGHPTTAPRFTAENSGADYVCVGEGEETAVELVKRLAAGRPADDVAGLATPARPDHIRRNPVQALDSLPFISAGRDTIWELKADGAVVRNDPILRGPVYTTRASRGCVFRCSFCCNEQIKELYDNGKFIRRRTPRNLMDELVRYLNISPDTRKIWFMDEIFPYDVPWVEEFSALYKREVGLPFSIWCYPSTTRKENMKRLRWAGLDKARIGLQSGSPSTRQHVFFRAEKQEGLVEKDEMLRELGVKRQYDLIVDHPWEAPDEMQQTFDLFARFKPPVRVHLHGLLLFPGTELARRAVAEKRAAEADLHERLVSPSSFKRAARHFSWKRHASPSGDLVRDLWIFLILATQFRGFPRWLLKLVSRLKPLRDFDASARPSSRQLV